MSKKLSIAATALFTVALMGINTNTASAQGFGGFLNVNKHGVSLSLGQTFGHDNCANAYYWRNETRRVWRPETYRNEFVPAIYENRFDHHGNPRQVLVRAGYNRRICVPGFWETYTERVRVYNPRHRHAPSPIFRRRDRDHDRRDARRHDRRDRRRNSRRHDRRNRRNR